MVINFYTDFRFQPKKLQGKITKQFQIQLIFSILMQSISFITTCSMKLAPG